MRIRVARPSSALLGVAQPVDTRAILLSDPHGRGPPRGMRIGVARPSSDFLGVREPVDKTDAGAFPAPRTVAVSTSFSVVDSVGTAADAGGGVHGGAAGATLRRPGRGQRRGGRLCPGA